MQPKINTREGRALQTIVSLLSVTLAFYVVPACAVIPYVALIMLAITGSYIFLYVFLLKNVLGYYIGGNLSHRLFGCHAGFWRFLDGNFNEIKHGTWEEIQNNASIPQDQRDHVLIYTHRCGVCGRLWDEAHGGISS